MLVTTQSVGESYTPVKSPLSASMGLWSSKHQAKMLHKVLESSNCENLEEFLLSTADQRDNKSLLTIAVVNGTEKTVEMLLSYEAIRKSINTKDESGSTALDKAMFNASTPVDYNIIRQLLCAGASSLHQSTILTVLDPAVNSVGNILHILKTVWIHAKFNHTVLHISQVILTHYPKLAKVAMENGVDVTGLTHQQRIGMFEKLKQNPTIREELMSKRDFLISAANSQQALHRIFLMIRDEHLDLQKGESPENCGMNIDATQQSLDLLLNAGYSPQLKDSKTLDFITTVVSSTEIMDKCARQNVRTLMELTKFKIRQNLNCNVIYGVEFLNLPKVLNRFVSLQ